MDHSYRVHARRPSSLSALKAGAALALFLPLVAYGAGVTYETTYVGGGRYVPNGVSAAGTVATHGPWGTKYHPIAATLPKAAFGTVARGMLRGGVYGVAIQAAIEGAGYLADQYTGDIQVPQEYEMQTPHGTGVRTYYATSGQGTASAMADFCSSSGYTYCATMSVGPDTVRGIAFNCPSGTYGTPDYALRNPGSTNSCWTLEPTQYTETTYTDATDDDINEIDNIIWENLSDAQKLAIAESYLRSLSPQGQTTTEAYPLQSLSTANPSLQAGYATWPELEAALVSTLNGQMAAYMASTDPTFEATPEEQAVADQATDAAPVEQAPEWPAICDWAPWLCEPFAGGEQPPVPRLDIEVPDYDSGLPTSAACPAPVALSLAMWGAHELSFTPVCSVAEQIRAPLLAIAYLMAAYIVVGVRR